MPQGETKDAKKSCPKRLKRLYGGSCFFFLGAVFVVSVFLPMTDGGLTQSPFVSVLEKIPLPFLGVGIPYAADIMNFVIVTAILSTANSRLYASGRMIYGLSQKKMFFPIFAKLNALGTPTYALYLSLGVTLVGMLTDAFAPEKIMASLINVVSFMVIIVWISISVAQYRFRKAYVASGKSLKDLPYKAPFNPLIQIVGIGGCLVGLVGAYMDANERIGGYLTLVFMGLCYVAYYASKNQWGYQQEKGL
ncbi:amino acid permease [Helicobacter acinonychis]|nr:amino acid permease [Helicobacter acinonychis]